jgi:plastocyanin
VKEVRCTLLSSALLAGLLPGASALRAVAPRATAPEDSPDTVLAGTVELLAHGGRRPARGEAVDEAIVWFEPLWTDPEVRAGEAVVETVDKSFVPRVLAVTVGSAVRFSNRVPILHNVFSVSRGNAFDLGLLEQGPGEEVTFERSGVVRVFCNVHHDMVAYLLVLETPWFAHPDERGRFVLRGLPPGPGTLHVWHERADPAQVPVTVETASGAGSAAGSATAVSPGLPPGGVEIRLEISKPRIPPHLNKFGRRYGRSRDRYP